MRALIIAAIVCASWPASADDLDDDNTRAALEAGERVERVPTRSGVTVPVLVREAQKPTAVVLLYAGGGGRLELSDAGLGKSADNFMVRTRSELAKAGFTAVVVDAPSDHAESLRRYRISSEGGDDTAKLVAWATAKWKLPVWLVGTSRGTISVANAAARGAGMRGVVLMSSVTAGKHETISDVAVAKIAVPALLVHHRHDGCNASPLAGAEALAKTLHATWIEIRGGDDDKTASKCSPQSHHGYLGQDAEVVGDIAGFIRAH
jgi:pimeloyl-ACP methyl ester carboxylesterase